MSTANQIEDGDEAYLSFGGWAKPMANAPKLHDRRRYVVDVECTEEATKSSEKGDRETRKLSILRVKEIVGVKVPAPDVDENQGELFDDDGEANDDAGVVVDFPDQPDDEDTTASTK